MPTTIPGTVTASSIRRAPGDTLWRSHDRKAQKEGAHHTVYFPSGERYQGEWSDNLKSGKGTLIYKNGDKYEGAWLADLRHGLGTLWVFRDSKYKVRYNGEWRDDQPTGHGTYFEDNGDNYEGEWYQGKRHGKGRAVYGGRPVDGFGADVYEGSWENDMKHGPGTMMFGNGDIFEGMWAFDKRHGSGTFFYMAKGKRCDGTWSDGVMKCGTYSEIHTPPPGTLGSLPPVELADPEGVLQTATQEVVATL